MLEISPRKAKERTYPPLEDLPKLLQRAVVNIMSRYNLDLPQAYDKLATLADSNSREFEAAITREADLRYKSKAMAQMNSMRATLNKNVNKKVQVGYDQGHVDGYAKAKADYAIYYYCIICGQPIYIVPGSESHQVVVNCMYQNGWGHGSCHEKQKKK